MADAYGTSGVGHWNIRGKGDGSCPYSKAIKGFTVHVAITFLIGDRYYSIPPSHLSKYKHYGYSQARPVVDCGQVRYVKARVKTTVSVDTVTGQGKVHRDAWGEPTIYLCGDVDGG